MSSLAASGSVECVIDAHTHLPIEPSIEPGVLLDKLRDAGISGAVILGIPPARQVLEVVTLEDVRREYGRVEELVKRYAPDVAWALSPEALYVRVAGIVSSYGELCSHEPRGGGYAIAAAVDLSLPEDELASRLENLASRGFAGFKVISTLQFKFLDDPSVGIVLDVAESRGLPVVVHTGCDPGIWELPRYCRYGDPSKLEAHLREHRDVPVVLAHMGGYSAIAPGVFTAEAVDLVRRYSNVYLDTSAVPGFLVRRVASSVPRGRILFGTDYPVIDVEDVEGLAWMVYRALRASGYSRVELEEAFHGLAEGLFGVECIDRL